MLEITYYVNKYFLLEPSPRLNHSR